MGAQLLFRKENMISLVKVAKDLTISEVGKSESNIGDVRELLRRLFTSYSLAEICQMWLKYNKVKV